ncbi:MAG: hypothetical protein AAGA48_22990 [Myxococcota bacterium]
MSLDQVLGDVRDELIALWGAGLATPGPGRADALRSLAETLNDAGLERVAGEVSQLAKALEGLVGETPSAEALHAVHERLQQLTTWEVQFRRAWALRTCRQTFEASKESVADSSRPPGLDATVVPLGVTSLDGRIVFVGELEGRSQPIVLHDHWPGFRGGNPFRQAQASRLFQDEVVPATLLAHKWRLRDHPAVQRRGRWIVGPSFFTRPDVLDEEVPRIVMPDDLTLRWSSDGWTLWREEAEHALEVAPSAALDFNLRKQRVYGPDLGARLAPNGDRHVLIAMADSIGLPCFPSVDPGAIRWTQPQAKALATRMAHRGVDALLTYLGCLKPSGRKRKSVPSQTFGEVVAGWLAGRPPKAGNEAAAVALAALGGAPAALVSELSLAEIGPTPTGIEVVRRALEIEDLAERKAFVQAHVVAFTRSIRRGGVVPAGRDLWALTALWSRLGSPSDPETSQPTLNGVPFDLDRLRLAAVNPLSRALRGEAVSAEEVEDALLLVVGSDDGASFFA